MDRDTKDIIDRLCMRADQDPDLHDAIIWADSNIQGNDIYEKIEKVLTVNTPYDFRRFLKT